MPFERLLDLRLARLGILGEQRLRGHDHAVAAEAALARLLLDERRLQPARLLRRAQALERGDALAGEIRDRRHARARLAAFDQHRAGAALPQAAAELRAVPLQAVAQDVEQRRLGLDV